MEREAIESLRKHLEGKSPGPIGDTKELVSLLGLAWAEFDGFDAEGMDSRKLRRMEDPNWDPPRLTFTIERHGAIVVGGSSRTGLQMWSVDLESATCAWWTPAVGRYARRHPLSTWGRSPPKWPRS